MMTENKRTIQKYIRGFIEGDHPVILSCLRDDVIWDMPGYFHHEGKEAFDKEIANENFTGLPDISIIRMVEESDVVVAEGFVKAKMKNGVILDALFCDVFHMQDGKITHLTTYQVNREIAG